MHYLHLYVLLKHIQDRAI